MKDILFLIGSLSGGGAERILVDTVNNLDKNDYNITVQTIFNEGVHISELNNNIKYKTILNIDNVICRKIIYKLFIYMMPSKLTYRLFVKGKYDYEVAFLEGLPTKIIGSSNSETIKYAWVHINFLNNFDSLKYFRNIEQYRKCYKIFNKIICVSEVAKNGFETVIGKMNNIEVVYNPLDEKKINMLANENNELLYTDKDILNLITIGRLSNQKGYDRLLNIIYKLKSDGYKFKLKIIGEGDKRKQLETLIKEYKINDVVELLGYKNNPYIYLKNSDLFVCSSREEGFSTVVTEAIILGIPVITTDCAGMKEIFGELNCGLIVDNNENELYFALKKVLDNPQLLKYYSEEAKKRGSYFKIEERIEELIKLFS